MKTSCYPQVERQKPQHGKIQFQIQRYWKIKMPCSWFKNWIYDSYVYQWYVD